jgi:predicted RNase H-like nuclease (RuvC/YqgF family)
MEMEMSKLRLQLEKSTVKTTSHSDQVSALEEKLGRAERAAGAAQRELLDVKKNLERASERAVKEGSERTSAETKIRSLGRELDETKKEAEQSMKRVETLEKKLATLTTLHKESDGRRQAGERERERMEKEATELRRKLAAVENTNLRLREDRERMRKREATGVDDDGVDELEDEERRRLEEKVRGLESEVSDLRRGIWREKRRHLSGSDGDMDPISPGSKFDEVDLTGGASPLFHRQSLASRGQVFTDVLSSGFNVLTGGGGRQGSEDLLLDSANDDFDEEAFRRAREEEAKKRVERVREVKRALKDWEGWRMDIVDIRVGGGAGEVFDV